MKTTADARDQAQFILGAISLVVWFIVAFVLGVRWYIDEDTAQPILLAGGIAEYHERLGTAPVQLSASLRLAALGMMLLTAGAVVGCNTNTFGPGITQQSTGTPTGTYTLGITGTLGNNNSVTRSTTMNLSVGPG